MRVLRQSWAWFANDPGRRVIAAALLLILGQLGFRAWAVYGGWFQFDDFSFMSRLMNEPLREAIFRDYAGHLMPAGMLLTWANMLAGPLDWWLPASELLLMQAVASAGCLVFLVSAFGRRPGILAPLSVYLFSAVSLPAFIWWAAGVNQLPLQIALFWGAWTHLQYLRSGRRTWAIATMLATIASLVFYEKTLFLFIVFAFLALAYFANGDLVERSKSIYLRYRFGVLLYSVIALGYLAVYIVFGLNFDPGRANDPDLAPVIGNVALRGFATGVLGGPFRWEKTTDLFAVASPSDLMVAICLGVIAFFLYEVTRSRRHSKRAWLLPLTLLSVNIVLLAGGRVSFVGPIIALDYRYQTELAAATAVALGLAILPLRGAVESSEATRSSNFLDKPIRVSLSVAIGVSFALYSSTLYINHWHGATAAREYFSTVETELDGFEEPVPLVDVGVPNYLMWGFAYPENTTSHVLKMYDDETRYPSFNTDQMFIISGAGQVSPLTIEPARRDVASDKACPHPSRNGSITVPLDGPVTGGGWWVRVSYGADRPTDLTVEAGEVRHEARGQQGLHNLFFEASGDFQEIQFTEIDHNAQFCITEIELGLPRPAMEGNASESGS